MFSQLKDAVMNVTTISSRIFNQDVGRAKRAAEHGPVFITDRGKPAYVLLRHEEWQRLAGPPRSLLDVLAMPESDAIEFDPPHLGDGLYRAADLA
jgi:hypothetical protein